MTELEPWAWKCKLDDSWIGRPFTTEREAAAQIPEFEAEGYSGVTVVPLYPLPAALAGLDPAAVRAVIEAARNVAYHRLGPETPVMLELISALAALDARKEETK